MTRYERRPFDGWVLLGAVLVFLACLPVVRSGKVPGWERAVFHGINGLPEALYRPMWLMQLVGLLLVPLAVAVVAAILRKWRLAICLVAFIPLKLFFEKARREAPGRAGAARPRASAPGTSPAGTSATCRSRGCRS